MSCATDSYRHHLTLPLSRKERGRDLSAVVHGRRDPRGEGFSQPLKTKMPRAFLTRGIGKYIRHRPDFIPPTCPPSFCRKAGLPYLKTKKTPCFRTGSLKNISGIDLLSHTVTRIVPSALRGLTSLFGMGRGVTPAI